MTITRSPRCGGTPESNPPAPPGHPARENVGTPPESMSRRRIGRGSVSASDEAVGIGSQARIDADSLVDGPLVTSVRRERGDPDATGPSASHAGAPRFTRGSNSG